MFKKPRNNKILYFFAFVTSVLYLFWRIFFTIPWEDSLFSYISGLILWMSELTSFYTAFVLIANKTKEVNLDKGEMTPENLPDIDVFIATHNEDYNIVYKTVNACVRMDYPDKSKVHIYIADDTNRPEIRMLAEEFSVGYFGLENNKHAKSGNLNNALSQTSSPYIATFDADMIPYKDFLLETVPYFLKERGDSGPIGLIQTPQSFYNPDIFQFHFYSEDKLPNEQDFFSKSVNVLNNTRGAAVYTGSNTLLSRKAIEEVGGFPTQTITEDFELGVRMNIAGYLNYSTTKPMASGLTPTDLRSVIKQRIRWGRGVIKSSYNVNIFFNPKLTIGQRLIYLNGYLYWSSFFRRLVYIIAPILYTVFHIRIVKANVWLLLIFWLPSYILTKLAMRDVTDTYRTQTWGEIVETVFAPYLVIPIFLESIGISEKKFKVTSKSISNRHFDYLFTLPYLILWLLSLYGLISFNIGKYGSELFYGSVISFWLLHHLINLTFALFSTLGRPIFRKEERFLVKENAILSIGDLQEKIQIVDVSEHGLSFVVSKPLYIRDTLKISLDDGEYEFDIKGQPTRVVRKNGEWLYGIKIVDLDKDNKREYFYYIYDRSNKYLTEVRDNWVTIWDDLFNNLIQRLHLMMNLNLMSSRGNTMFPEVLTNFPVSLNGEPMRITKFNVSEIELSYDSQLTPKEYTTFDNSDIRLNLQKKMISPSNQLVCYKVVSFEEKTNGGIQRFYNELYMGSVNGNH
ncbi:glycosyltransferase family 2 protein [Streptococcus uberis]|uniref:glycosyltransferase family 2 protein n=1 Tax=Streptococcus uberis TaxID=1349 RepID=UPI00193C0793|nr:glycosyltransferase [Streptococcus uberis]